MIFLDPSFWQSLIKAIFDMNKTSRTWWKHEWHRFIDHLADGKSAEQFFADLDVSTRNDTPTTSR
jgi:hypothetical protein